MFPIPFPAEVPGQKEGPALKRFIKKGTGYAWQGKGRTFQKPNKSVIKG
jgi:hypothetical protein